MYIYVGPHVVMVSLPVVTDHILRNDSTKESEALGHLLATIQTIQK